MSRPPKSSWEGITNLKIRNGICYYRGEHAGAETWRSLHIEADPEAKNLPLVKDSLRAL